MTHTQPRITADDVTDLDSGTPVAVSYETTHNTPKTIHGTVDAVKETYAKECVRIETDDGMRVVELYRGDGDDGGATLYSGRTFPGGDRRMSTVGSATLYVDHARYLCEPKLADQYVPRLPEKLQRGFERLRERQFVTIEGDVCCSTCASHSAGMHADALEDEGVPVNGTAHVHIQNLERDPDDVYVGYGPDEAAGQAVVDAFEAAGCDVEWDGDVATKVRVQV